jgi:hypothetical protein
VEAAVIVLGLVLLLVGWLTGISILYMLGFILLIIGVILWALGASGHAIGPRSHYW